MNVKHERPASPSNGNGNGMSNGNGDENGNGNGEATALQPVGAVLVCGGGVAGIQASLDLSAAGYRVYLVEESPTIGGGMARLDKTFPTGDCATCIISPKLVECMRDYNIDVLTMSDVTRLEGEAGHFTAEIRERPRSVDASKCTGCGDCWQACPVRNVPQPIEPIEPSEPLPPADAAKLNEILARHAGKPGRSCPCCTISTRPTAICRGWCWSTWPPAGMCRWPKFSAWPASTTSSASHRSAGT